MGLFDWLHSLLHTKEEWDAMQEVLMPDPYDPTEWLGYDGDRAVEAWWDGPWDEDSSDYENDIENLDTTEGED